MRFSELSEAEEQELVIKWADWMKGAHPELEKLLHSRMEDLATLLRERT